MIINATKGNTSTLVIWPMTLILEHLSKSFIVVLSHSYVCLSVISLTGWHKRTVQLNYLPYGYGIYINTLRLEWNERYFIDGIYHIIRTHVHLWCHFNEFFLVHNGTLWVKAIAWYRVGPKLLPEPMVTQLTDAHMFHWASLRKYTKVVIGYVAIFYDNLWHGKAFCINGLLLWESIGHWWVPSQRVSSEVLLCNRCG